MSSFEPTAYVKSWLVAGRHAETDMGKTKKETEVRAGPGQVAIWKYCRGPNLQSFCSNCCKV